MRKVKPPSTPPISILGEAERGDGLATAGLEEFGRREVSEEEPGTRLVVVVGVTLIPKGGGVGEGFPGSAAVSITSPVVAVADAVSTVATPVNPSRVGTAIGSLLYRES